MFFVVFFWIIIFCLFCGRLIDKCRQWEIECAWMTGLLVTLPEYRATLKLCGVQDVSDLLEKEPEKSVIVRRLDSDSVKVIHKDWSQHITESLRTGMLGTVLFQYCRSKICRLFSSIS